MKDEILTILIILALCAAVLVAGFFILLSAFVLWPLSIILAIVGGFMGGGLGSLIGVIISGAIGLIIFKIGAD